MSYSTDINSNIINITADEVVNLLRYTNTRQYKYSSGLGAYKYGNAGTRNIRIENALKSDKGSYIVKNTVKGEHYYNLYDIVAALKATGISNDQIKYGLNEAGIKAPNGNQWESIDVQQLNSNTTSTTKRIQEHLDKYYSGLDPYVSVLMNPDGNGYNIRVTYKDPKTNERIYKNISNFKGIKDGTLTDSALVDELFGNSELGQGINNALTQHAEINYTKNNATQQSALADKVLTALNGNVGSNANAYNDLTQADIDAVTAKLPSTNNLQAWNQGKDTNVLSTALKNIQDANPDLLERASLKDLQDLAGIISGEQVGTTQRNINNQQRQLLQQIQNDPELYNAVTQQLRADNVAGTIAGQRAANAQQLATQTDATYDKSASDLYSSLFTGENAVAGATRDSVMGNQVSASDAYIQSMLNNAIEAARQGQISSQDLATFVKSMSTALDTDQSVYDNAIAEKQAAAGVKASDIASGIDATTKNQLATNDAKLKQVSDMLGIGSDYLQSAANGNADVSAALQTIIDGFTNNNALSGGYKKVNTPEQQKAEQFTNKQYTDFINSDAFKTFLSDDTIDSLTKSKTLEEILGSNGLDILTEDGMKALYEGYVTDANAQSDKVFNQAQRAYIAAVTAGDAKTTEQLTKLAVNANASKRNLYTASALANQYKQQFGLNNTGRQLATDYQNQQSANQQAISNAALSANKALTGYIGNGADGYDAGTVYAVKNLWDSAAASNREQYGALGNKLMSTTQGLNTSNVSNNINNYDRLAQLASQYTAANASAAANNIANSATRNSLTTQAQAMQKQAETTLDSLKNKNK